MVARDPQSGVELLGDALPYVDGAENELGEVFATVGDRSSSSDALAAHVHDWPTKYHLTRQRSNLLRPLSIGPGMRVLDVGAGTGSLARYLGEQGAEVVALEGNLSRARAAALRCEGLSNVRVVCGSVGDLEVDVPFDVVVVVGVLEYAEHSFGGGLSPESFIASVRRLASPQGVVALAIENQLGLKYLLGYAEDHIGAAWVGVEGYPVRAGVRTYSRRALARLLEAAGLPPRRWLYPYPDYKLPAVVLAQRCFSEPDATTMVDQLVRTPVVDHAHPRERFCDDRAALATFVQAGLGEDVANSFLVVAGDPSAAAGLVDDDVLAWHFGSERLSMWLRTKRVLQRGEERTVETAARTDDRRQRGWLQQRITRVELYVSGPTLERLALDALAKHDIDAVAAILTSWHDYVACATTPVEPNEVPPAHPFLRVWTRSLLPEDHLDVELANFIRAEDGGLEYVDREWCALGGVDFELAVTRALWSFAHRLVVSGAEIPWSATTTVDELAVVLGSLCGVRIGPALLQDWRVAEDALQSLVSGLKEEDGAQRRVTDGRLSRSSFPLLGRLPFTTLRRQIVRLGLEVEAVKQESAAATERALAVEKDFGAAKDEFTEIVAEHEREAHRLAEQLAEVRDELSVALSSLGSANEELAYRRARAAAFERRLLVRIYRKLLRRPRVV